MPIRATKFHEFDPDTEYVEIASPGLRPINPPAEPDAVYCCQCTEGDHNICDAETASGTFLSKVSAQAFAYWVA